MELRQERVKPSVKQRDRRPPGTRWAAELVNRFRCRQFTLAGFFLSWERQELFQKIAIKPWDELL